VGRATLAVAAARGGHGRGAARRAPVGAPADERVGRRRTSAAADLSTRRPRLPAGVAAVLLLAAAVVVVLVVRGGGSGISSLPPNTVGAIDPKTNKVAATIEVGVPGEGGDIAAGEGSVWVTSFEFPISRIDPASNTVVQQFAGKGGDAAVFERVRPVLEQIGPTVTHVGGKPLAPRGVRVFNPAFDVTPARLVTAIVTECGAARPPYRRSLPAHVRRAGEVVTPHA